MLYVGLVFSSFAHTMVASFCTLLLPCCSPGQALSYGSCSHNRKQTPLTAPDVSGAWGCMSLTNIFGGVCQWISLLRAKWCPCQIWYAVALTPSTPECDCTWKQSLSRGNKVAMRSSGWSKFNHNRCSWNKRSWTQGYTEDWPCKDTGKSQPFASW